MIMAQYVCTRCERFIGKADNGWQSCCTLFPDGIPKEHFKKLDQQNEENNECFLHKNESK